MDPTHRKPLLYLVFKVRLHEATEFDMYYLVCVAVAGVLKCLFSAYEIKITGFNQQVKGFLISLLLFTFFGWLWLAVAPCDGFGAGFTFLNIVRTVTGAGVWGFWGIWCSLHFVLKTFLMVGWATFCGNAWRQKCSG